MPFTSSFSSRVTQWRRALLRRLRRFKQLTVIYIFAGGAVLLLVILGGLGAAIVIPTSRAVKAWHARRLSEQAMALIDQQQWQAAAAKTHDALILRPTEPTTQEAAARLLTRTGQGAAAIAWWKQINASRGLTVDDRRDFASAALSASELSLAATQIDFLRSQQGGPEPIDLCLDAQLATLRGDPQTAIATAEKVLVDKRSAPDHVFAALAVIFLNAAPGSPSYVAAYDRLAELARGDQGFAGLEALRLIAKSPPRPRLTDEGNTPLTIVRSTDNLIPRTEIADRLDHYPKAKPADRLLALGIRLEQQPERGNEDIRQAVEEFRDDEESLAALTAWLYEKGQFETILELVPPQLAASKREFFIERVNALAALNRDAELETMLLADNLSIDQISQYLYLAVVQSKLGKLPASQNEWERAMQTATDAHQFLRIAKYAETHGALEVADSAYKQSLVLEPKLRLAHLARLRLTEAMGHTADAQRVAAEIVKLWPDDTATQLHYWYLELLRGGSAAEMTAIEKNVEDLVSQTSLGSDASATLALARLRSGRPAAALSAFTFQGVPVALATPNALTVHVAVLAANGWKDQAREEAKKLTADKLLPEERTLLGPLLDSGNETPAQRPD